MQEVKVIELKVDPKKKFSEIVEDGRKNMKSLKLPPGSNIKFVGYKLYYLAETEYWKAPYEMGEWAEGFSMEDYDLDEED